MRWLSGKQSLPAPAFQITTARKSVADDQAARVRGYVISMTIRIVCFLLAVVTTGVLRWLFVAAALIIPYIAVVVANGGRRAAEAPPDSLRLSVRRELPSGSDHRTS